MLDSSPTTVHDRVVSNDNVAQWDGRRFQIPPQPNASGSPAPESNSVNHFAKPPTSTTETASFIMQASCHDWAVWQLATVMITWIALSMARRFLAGTVGWDYW